MLPGKKVIGMMAGVFASLVLAYCVYFDYRRVRDPNYKKKLRDRRSSQQNGSTLKVKPESPPDLKKFHNLQEYFMEQVLLGEERLSAGDIKIGINHLANAVVLCRQPNELLNVLKNTLPTPMFELLMKELDAKPEFGKENFHGLKM